MESDIIVDRYVMRFICSWNFIMDRAKAMWLNSCTSFWQEQASSDVAENKLDADEDKQNPAYVPRTGNFYEHDMRIATDADTANKTE